MLKSGQVSRRNDGSHGLREPAYCPVHFGNVSRDGHRVGPKANKYISNVGIKCWSYKESVVQRVHAAASSRGIKDHSKFGGRATLFSHSVHWQIVCVASLLVQFR